jgi:hypothetical protein
MTAGFCHYCASVLGRGRHTCTGVSPAGGPCPCQGDHGDEGIARARPRPQQCPVCLQQEGHLARCTRWWEELAQGRDASNCEVFSKFVDYNQRNPHFEGYLEQVADLIFQRRERYSVYTLIEVARWHVDTNVIESGDEDYRVPNGVKPWYARRLLWKHPEWVGRLEYRRLFCACGPPVQRLAG